jgi:hypothetical protein
VVVTAKSDDPYQQTATATAVATVTVSNLVAPIFTATTTPVIVATSTAVIVSSTSSSTVVSTPKLPNAGFESQTRGANPWNIIIPSGALFLVALSLMIVLKKKKA